VPGTDAPPRGPRRGGRCDAARAGGAGGAHEDLPGGAGQYRQARAGHAGDAADRGPGPRRALRGDRRRGRSSGRDRRVAPGTGAEAIRVAEETQPDVMLLDVRLGDIDGPEVCHRVLLASAKTAVVMLTNYQQDELILRSLLAGAKGYVIKDVDLDELKKMIR